MRQTKCHILSRVAGFLRGIPPPPPLPVYIFSPVIFVHDINTVLCERVRLRAGDRERRSEVLCIQVSFAQFIKCLCHVALTRHNVLSDPPCYRPDCVSNLYDGVMSFGGNVADIIALVTFGGLNTLCVWLPVCMSVSVSASTFAYLAFFL